jgi:two-component system chemotaxis sensor kinase CheA
VDHGVEPAELRQAAGKPARATIRLTAEAANSRLLIRLIDDGRGIDPTRIRTIAAERGLLALEQTNDLSDQEAIELVFLPGFSTALEVSALSGRGVGMDAVRAAVHRLGGSIALASQIGVGTEITLSLPLSVSLTKIVVVSDGDQHYGLPLDRVLETVRLPAGAAAPIRAGYAFNWRERSLPLLALSALTGGRYAPLGGSARKVMVIRANGQPVGLAIDGIVGRLDVAMRPPEGLLAAMPGLAGTTLLGNGQVLIILDPEALVA